MSFRSHTPFWALLALFAAFSLVKFGDRLWPVSGSKVIQTSMLYPLEEGRTWEFVEHSESFGNSKRTYVASKKGDGWMIDQAGRGILNAMPMYYKISSKGIETRSGFLGAQKTKFAPAFLELPNVVELGKAWSWRGELSQSLNVEIRSVYRGEETVTVPAGTFEAVKIVRQVASEVTFTHWYARDVGPIKVLSERPMHSSSMELVAYTKLE